MLRVKDSRLTIITLIATSPVYSYEAQKLISRLGLALKAPEHAARNSRGARLLDAAHHHAQMARLHDDGDALGLEDLHDGVGDFLGQAFLDLEAARVHLGDAGELGEADDGVGGDVANVHLQIMGLAIGCARGGTETCLAGKGYEVVLAQTVNFDILDNNHFVVALVEKRIVYDVFHVDLVALG